MAQKMLVLAFAVLLLMVLTLVSCGAQPRVLATPAAARLLLGTPEAITPANDPLLAAIALTQAQESADAQAAATAEMARAMAQAVLNSANATLGVAQTQTQNDANQYAAQLAATAQIVSANANATLIAAAATQAAAQTQDAIRQTQTAAFATSDAQTLLGQQTQAASAADTQTAVANVIATQTQSALATADDQKLQREQQMQAPISFLWMICLPIFMVLLAGLVLWGFWRWLRIQQANQHLLENSAEVLPAPQPRGMIQPQDDPLYLDGSVADHHPHLTRPDDQVTDWLDEVKNELISSDEKDKNDNPNG